MNKIKILTFITVLLLGLTNTIPAMAASGSAKVSGGGTYNIGDTIKIKVSVSADETLYGVDLGISYNPEVLQYQSGADSNSSGIARIARPASSSSFSYTINFKAIASGSSTVSVIDAIGASTTEFKLSGGSTKVTVKAPVTYSSDSSLKSLQVSPGKLSPSFSSGTRKYSMTVDNDVKKISVSAVAKDDGAKVTSVSGNNNLKVGENKISVVVTAEDGSRSTYTITVTRKAAAKQNNVTPTTKPSSEEKPTTKPVEKPMDKPVDKPVDKPIENPVEEPIEQPVETPVVPTEKPVEEMIELKIKETDYVLLTPAADVIIPTGFEKAEATIMDKKFNVWKPMDAKDSEFYLVYGMNQEGNKGWYLYDTQEETIQRFSEEIYKINQKEEAVTALQQNANIIPNTRNLDSSEAEKNTQKIILIIVLSVVAIFGIIGYIRKRQYK